MNPSALADADLVTLPSTHGATETVERLKSLLSQKKIQVFADVDHAARAQKVGLSLRPTHLLIFGNPQAGTPLMQSQQTIGLDLPLRVLVWEDEAGKVWLTYHRPEFLGSATTSLTTTKQSKPWAQAWPPWPMQPPPHRVAVTNQRRLRGVRSGFRFSKSETGPDPATHLTPPPTRSLWASSSPVGGLAQEAARL